MYTEFLFYIVFLQSPNGTSNLWQLINVLQGSDVGSLDDSYRKGVTHMKHTLTLRHASAHELAMRRTSKFGGGGGIHAKSREEQLREAAETYLRSGNLQRHCDVLAELGEWDRALALAPGVSMSYWKELCGKRVSNLKTDQSDLVVPYAVAAGDVKTLVAHFKSLGLLQVRLGYQGLCANELMQLTCTCTCRCISSF